MIIRFNGVAIDNKYIMSLSQEAQVFTDQFELGSTICRTLTLNVDKRGVSSIPSSVDIVEPVYQSNIKLLTETNEDLLTQSGDILLVKDGITYDKLFSLVVDDIDDTNDFYYSFTLMDKMVQCNKVFEYQNGKTVLQLLDLICTNHNMTLATRNLYLGDMVINWSQSGMTEREFIGYVAEVNGGYAYIDNNGNLNIVPYSQNSQANINVSACSSFKLGSKHIIDRVYVELASATKYYPETTNNETCYLNPDNILLTDSGSYTIENIVKHIQNEIDGLTFYNITVERFPINDTVRAGQMITFVNGELSYPTILQINYDYSKHWLGGIELDLDSSYQKETQIKNNTDKMVKEIKIVVDRELGTIEQRVSDNEDNISQILQDAEGLTGTFQSYKGVKYIKANIDGITISSNDVSSPTELNLDNDGVRIKDANNNEVAVMEADTFRTSEWMMTQTKDNTVFNVFRRWNN